MLINVWANCIFRTYVSGQDDIKNLQKKSKVMLAVLAGRAREVIEKKVQWL